MSFASPAVSHCMASFMYAAMPKEPGWNGLSRMSMPWSARNWLISSWVHATLVSISLIRSASAMVAGKTSVRRRSCWGLMWCQVRLGPRMLSAARKAAVMARWPTMVDLV